MIKKSSILSAISVCALQSPLLSAAQLEEVIVTAQIREQSLQDVPVSVSAISGSKMMEAGLSKIEDLQAYVPNFTMTESSIGTDIYIRGIGSGENQGFEQSVGMYVDGIYYGRAQLARAPFLDLARVEVLRGPQNILLGKNSIAGAINISTASPTEETELFVQGTYEPELNEQVLDFVVSGALSDNINARFAMRQRHTDGFVENQVLDRDEAERNEATYRLKFGWDAGGDFDAMLKLEVGSFDVVGRQSEIISDYASDSDIFLFTGRTYGEILNDTVFPDLGGAGNILGSLPLGLSDLLQLQENGSILNMQADDSVLDTTADRKRHSNGDFSNNDTQNITLNMNWYSDGNTLTSITGYMAYQYDEECDCDFTGAPLFQVVMQEEYEQFSQEFRWVSAPGENFDIIAGAYFQYNDLYFFDSIVLPSTLIPQLINAADLLEGGGRGDIDPLANGSSAFEVLGIGDAGNSLIDLRSPRDFKSDSIIASTFMQGTWIMSDSLRLTLGGRYTYEKKSGSRKLEFTLPDGSVIPIGETDTAAAVTFAAERHDLAGKRTESQFSPLLNLQWDINDVAMAYFSARRGFKSGGYDARSNSSPSDEPTASNPNATIPNTRVLIGSFEFEEERATSYELGLKTSLFDGVAELNSALFYTEFDNLQVSVYDGTLGFNVGNAAGAVTQGMEFDGRIALSEHLILGAGLAFLDFEFLEHEFGTCIQDQVPDNANGINCDYTGKTNQYAADYSGNILLGYETDIGDSLILRANLDAIFSDEYHPSPNLDDRVKQDAFIQYNGRISLSANDGEWEVALVGKNLTDELILLYAIDTPVAKNVIAGTTTHHGFTNPPRTVALQASYRW
ncbi:Vitamin B12 transporter BtuB [Zhongshania aliphaticivorans]|uniref:Vitamin B12 transporter BtuB n=1 Tax=Zhongshania aliphaticivorans TaxID=1470434 RepID=A0A5S9NIX0_9GAMM|nr:TonB-dependent receptor [Zhongshania aliphaticivorans]CAA0088729.1 Vitamin B12 transporter BtuB [Zhongshania aliphaticivorans]